ncbi:MAG TPA: preprotein translocase subunit SecE [Phycisphaerales bacterium]|nr:preprotein translocase subunit SecE [Phycisphaerales bacterium]
MAIGIYKQGQGYWVRVMTATLVAVLTFAASAWVFGQMRLVAEKLPRSVWVLRLDKGLATQPDAGDTVTLMSKGTEGAASRAIGTASVDSYNAGAKELRVKAVKVEAGIADASLTGMVRVGTVDATISGTPTGETAVDPFLLQGVAAAVVLLLGAILAYYMTAMHRRFVEFLIATDGEMKKVNWSTARDIRMSTVVVILASVTMAGSLFVVDIAFQWFFTKIQVLTPPDQNKKG